MSGNEELPVDKASKTQKTQKRRGGGQGDKLIQQQNQDQASLPLPKAMNT